MLQTALGWFYLVWYCLDSLVSCTVANCSRMILVGLILSWLPLILYCRELLWDDFTWSDIVLIDSYPVLTQMEPLWDDFTWSDIVLIPSYPVLSRTALGWFYFVWYCLDYLLSCTVASCSGMILLGLILSWFRLILYTDSVAHCSGMILLGLILSWYPLRPKKKSCLFPVTLP